LKLITNIIQDEAVWDSSITPEDEAALEYLEVNLQDSIVTALQNRPEYAQTKLDLANSDISIKLAKNRRLPTLDLEGSYSLNGLGEELNDPLSQVGSADYRSWAVGLVLRMPLGERGSRADLRRNEYEKEQKLLAMKDLEQQIITEVREAVRQVGTERERREATKVAEELARQVVSTEERKYKLGLSTSYDLLQFQADLATATRNHLRAVVDYRRSVVGFYQVLGVTLDRLNIQLDE
jgi:outer membrane protein TolC